MMKPPTITPQLLSYLDSIFPDVAVDPAKVDPSVAFGSALVIRHLRHVAQSQEEDPTHVSFET